MKAISLLLSGTLASVAAGTVGAAVVGPSVRRVFGVPYDYGSDYTSTQALLQALLVQTGTLLAVFLLGGWLLSAAVRDWSWKDALSVANPLTLGVAFLLLMLWFDGAQVLDGQVTWEYIGTAMWGFQVCLAAPLYAPALQLGARVQQRRQRA